RILPTISHLCEALSMTGVSNDLFLAILAMDSYNRGSDVRVDVGGRTPGNAQLGRTSNPGLDGFAAQAYTWNDQTVISYRGTDQLIAMLTGWITGARAFGSQAALAVQFYQEVVGKSVWDGKAENVILTGHSLGGGLAGLIASLTGDRAEIFDNMP